MSQASAQALRALRCRNQILHDQVFPPSFIPSPSADGHPLPWLLALLLFVETCVSAAKPPVWVCLSCVVLTTASHGTQKT